MKLQTVTRYATVGLMAAAVLIATADGFAQSYAGLLSWAHEHRVTGWKADSFPLLVDLFVAVGEMGLFLLAVDGHKLTRRALLPWVDLVLPAATAATGWAVSLAFNVGRIRGGSVADQVTAAVPPVAAMVGLVILLRTLHRYVSAASAGTAELQWPITDPASQQTAPVPALRLAGTRVDAMASRAQEWFAEVLAMGCLPSVAAIERDLTVSPAEAEQIRAQLGRLVDGRLEPLPDGFGELAAEGVPGVPAAVPEPDPLLAEAAERFADLIAEGRTPSIRAIKRTLRIGQPRAGEVQAHLAVLADR